MSNSWGNSSTKFAMLDINFCLWWIGPILKYCKVPNIMSRIIGWYWKRRIYNTSTIALFNFFRCVHDEKIFINWFQTDSNHALVYFCRFSHTSLTICSRCKSCILLLLTNYWNSSSNLLTIVFSCSSSMTFYSFFLFHLYFSNQIEFDLKSIN